MNNIDRDKISNALDALIEYTLNSNISDRSNSDSSIYHISIDIDMSTQHTLPEDAIELLNKAIMMANSKNPLKVFIVYPMDINLITGNSELDKLLDCRVITGLNSCSKALQYRSSNLNENCYFSVLQRAKVHDNNEMIKLTVVNEYYDEVNSIIKQKKKQNAGNSIKVFCSRKRAPTLLMQYLALGEMPDFFIDNKFSSLSDFKIILDLLTQE